MVHLLMDLRLPGMNGYEVTRVIREDLKSGVPIVAVTAHAMASVKEECLSCGMNDFLAKPFREDQIKEVIVRWLGDRH